MDSRPADRFPADGGGGGGFDNNADTLFVPPILLERYLQAAGSVLAEAEPERLFMARPVWHRRDRAVAGENLAWFAARAYRRPLEAGEVERLLGLYDAARKGGMPFALALRSAYKAVLVSPNFLFRVEREQPGGKPWRISDHELASRLSYFLWSSMPDEELLVLATAGTLSDAGILEAQVRRMLRDPKASALAGQFTAQWLGTKTLAITSSPDRSKFPRYTDTLRDADSRKDEQRRTKRDERVRAQARGLAAQFTIQPEHRADERGAAEAKQNFLPAECVKNVHACGVSEAACSSPALRGGDSSCGEDMRAA